jgi:hypothetical protein
MDQLTRQASVMSVVRQRVIVHVEPSAQGADLVSIHEMYANLPCVASRCPIGVEIGQVYRIVGMVYIEGIQNHLPTRRQQMSDMS